MTRTCFFFLRNPLNVSSVRWCTSLATSLQSFSGGGGGGGSFGLNIQTQTNIKLTQSIQYVNNIRKMLGRLFTVSYFFCKWSRSSSYPYGPPVCSQKYRVKLGMGIKSAYRGEWGAPSPTATNPNPPPSPSTFETKMATRRQSARSRRSYGKIRGYEQSNYISKILGGPNGGSLKEDAP